MSEEIDTYRTLIRPSPEVLYKEKKSKFYGYAFPIQSEDEVKTKLDELRKKHHSVNHVCYAWQLGVEKIRYRANDDGEPNNSAGMRIYGQIQSFQVTNVLVAVARIFGGTKLGVGGLISAYRTAAQMALEASRIVEKNLEVRLRITFAYPEMEKVMRIIKQHNIQITSQEMATNCELLVRVQKSELEKVSARFLSIPRVELSF
ncbi:IMPACT family protein [Maribacter halichondriae]|uniref:IMPACT family protein n=1 Tax=Maribacter halichondriae TaxID=2980554 RepID=UPI002359B001|nr:YigZ family protein [Maribacter sp. Hal144]